MPERAQLAAVTGAVPIRSAGELKCRFEAQEFDGRSGSTK
jgi:hypothetical protein